jgi:hypothetical protein
MHCKEYTIGSTEFNNIHNALYELQWHDDAAVKNAVEVIRENLEAAYTADAAAFKAKSDHYQAVGDRLALSTFWSVYEVDDLSSPHPYRGAQTLVYKNHWGENPVYVPIGGTTWADLWVAANAAIKQSGDNHHWFIEGFRQASEDLYLHTGS